MARSRKEDTKTKAERLQTILRLVQELSLIHISTPSAAAELAVPDREEQQHIFENIEENIHKNIQKRLALGYNGLEQYNFLLEQSAPSKILQQYSSRLHRCSRPFRHSKKRV